MGCRKRVARYGATVDKGPLRATVSIDLDPVVRHVSEFISLRCAPDYLAAGLLPRGTALKELTESMAAFAAVRRHVGQERLGDPTVRVLDVGCGHAPRTAALFAFRTRWQTTAIDPELRLQWEGRVRRVECVRGRVQDFRFTAAGLLVVTMVHAHVGVIDTLRAVDAPTVLLVAMPCCVPLELPGRPPSAEFADFACLSPQRTVKIWELNRSDREALAAPVEVQP